jgi:hypothetical protein
MALDKGFHLLPVFPGVQNVLWQAHKYSNHPI